VDWNLLKSACKLRIGASAIQSGFRQQFKHQANDIKQTEPISRLPLSREISGKYEVPPPHCQFVCYPKLKAVLQNPSEINLATRHSAAATKHSTAAREFSNSSNRMILSGVAVGNESVGSRRVCPVLRPENLMGVLLVPRTWGPVMRLSVLGTLFTK
jgi:hypothetical protein